MAIKIPSEFIIKTGSGSLKFIRLASERANGDSNGFMDIQIIDDDISTLPADKRLNSFGVLRELQHKWFYFGERDLITRDQWHKIDVYIAFDKELAANGGKSKVIIWFDNKKIHEENNIKTIINDGDYFHALYLFTYWNGTAPQDQHLWVDEVKMSTANPQWRMN